MAAHWSPCFSPAVPSQLGVENEPDQIQVRLQPPGLRTLHGSRLLLPLDRLTRSHPVSGSPLLLTSLLTALPPVRSWCPPGRISPPQGLCPDVPATWDPHCPFQSCSPPPAPPPTKQTQSPPLPLLLPQTPSVLSHSCINSLFIVFIVHCSFGWARLRSQFLPHSSMHLEA